VIVPPVPAVKPLLILVVLPLAIGFVAEHFARHTRAAAVAATLVSSAMVFAALMLLDPTGTWNWLATLLVLPLPISLTLAAVQLAHGRAGSRKHPMRKLGI
jgi:peptidoglycan/LPS O-acetylase OafA/YrhL